MPYEGTTVDIQIRSREMLVNYFCDFCGMSQKAMTAICQWCQITIHGYIDNPDSSVRLLQKSQTM